MGLELKSQPMIRMGLMLQPEMGPELKPLAKILANNPNWGWSQRCGPNGASPDVGAQDRDRAENHSPMNLKPGLG